ncbi:auxin-responsive protein IAA14-like [Lolium rigidum]|uniref:auxin-responsive protein IAA14-like n=1 Tax=Lolium rigidum TaxID=89674 RepID=UPI001F5D1717|nr:auxin-responsive protein IAA14-like [Lolium rigidum]
MEIIDAELRLGPPGSGGGCDLAFAGASAAQKKRPSSSSAAAAARSEASGTDDHDAAPASKVQVVGWPPVGAYRKSTFFQSATSTSTSTADKEKGEARESAAAGKRPGAGGGLYVKVSMDGAPYLRKVDLRTYGGYGELRAALDRLFGCFSSPDPGAAGQFAVAYEDKDGDLMLAGDVPWDMFISSCKRLRIMRGSEAR